MAYVTDIHLRPIGIYMESKHNVKDRLFQKECRAVN